MARMRATMRFAVSDHAADGHLTAALASLRTSMPLLRPDVIVGSSAAMREAYDRGEAEAAVVRQESARRHPAVYGPACLGRRARFGLAVRRSGTLLPCPPTACSERRRSRRGGARGRCHHLTLAGALISRLHSTT